MIAGQFQRCRRTLFIGLTFLSAVLLWACESGAESPVDVSSGQFPDGFLMGTATAGFQVDMGCPTLAREICVDAESDWYQFVTDEEMIAERGNHLSGEDPAVVGPGHWELFEQDFDLAADELHSNAFRMSIEWSRIFPTPTDEAQTFEDLAKLADQNAVQHYHDVFSALRARNMVPLVTIHHYTMPIWIHDGVACHLDFENCSNRGWVDRERAVSEITKYTEFVAREFGDEVDLWATQNEPFAVVLPGYILPTPERANPPSLVLAADAAKISLVAMVEAHARMVEAVRRSDMGDADGDGSNASVGLIYAVAPVMPANPEDAMDVRAAENIFYLWNLVFLDAIILGRLDADLSGDSDRSVRPAGTHGLVGGELQNSRASERSAAFGLPRGVSALDH